MLTLELDRQLEARLLEIARKERQTPAQIINQLLAQYLSNRQSSTLLVDVAKALPAIEAFSAKDPLSIQQEMRDEWR
jgi:predicted transcriptional regulator